MVGIFSGIVSLLSGGLVKDVGDAIDRNVTSDEERLKLRNELEEIAARREEESNKLTAVIETNVTERHKADMGSDSKLAKNVRPGVLIALTAFTIVYISVPVVKELTEHSAKAYEVALTALISLDMLVYGFYFGSRGMEKISAVLGNLTRK